MKRIDLIERLNDALADLYHNATPSYPDLESDYEQDLFQSWFEDYASFEIQELRHDAVFGDFVREYGPLYTYGRGGRTLAPSKLIVTRGGSSFRPARVEDLDLNPLEMRRLLKLVVEFNRAVEGWNKAIPEMWRDAVVANEWQQDIDANAGKRRRNRVVYE